MLTGQVPFQGKSNFDVAAAHVQTSPDFSILEGVVSPHILRVLAIALDKDAQRRWASASSMSKALFDENATPVEAPPPTPPDTPPPPNRPEQPAPAVHSDTTRESSTLHEVEAPVGGTQSKRNFILLAAAAVILLVAWQIFGTDTKRKRTRVARAAPAKTTTIFEKKKELDWNQHYRKRFGVDYSDAHQYSARRQAMVKEKLEIHGTLDRNVIDAMAKLPMEIFCPDNALQFVYGDRPVPVGFDETISQPHLTAHMLTLLGIKPGDRVLELKTASGYQTAIMAMLGANVYTVESDKELGKRLAALFDEIAHGVINLQVGGDVFSGRPEHGPYDVIVATATYTELPLALLEQLKPGGRLLAPIGPALGGQKLRVYNKNRDGQVRPKDILDVRFSMMPTADILLITQKCRKAVANLAKILTAEMIAEGSPKDAIEKVSRDTATYSAKCVEQNKDNPNARAILDCMISAKDMNGIRACSKLKP
jgi:protein-L-isoaspartate(D-aspartate) O-methyltransferase